MSANLLQPFPPPADEWPSLVPLDAPNLPRLNARHLPGWAGDFAEAATADAETPPELAVGTILVSCAVAAARRLRVLVHRGYFEPCNLWVLTALVPGNRKSRIHTVATAPLMDWEHERAESMIQEIKRTESKRKTMEARAKELRNQAVKEKNSLKRTELEAEVEKIEAEIPEIPRPPQLWTSDVTPENLGTILADNGECMAWLSPEGGFFEGMKGRYSGGIPNLDLVLKSRTGDSDRVDRGSRPPVFLRHPLTCIGLTVQPDVVRGLAAVPGFRGRGLLGRFLYLLPPSPLGYRTLEPKPMPESVVDAYAAGLRAMLDWPVARDDKDRECKHLLRLSREARAIRLEFARQIEVGMRAGQQLEHFTDWAGKAPGFAVNVAGILHGIKHSHGEPWAAEITDETMGEALEIMTVVTAHSLAALDMMGADPEIAGARLVWNWIERNRLERFKARDAFNALRGTFPKMALLMHTMEVLQERGYLEIIEPPRDGAGRPPSPMVRVRPEITEAWR